MKSVGIRDLRQHATRYLRLVEAGESVQVTDRGRPIALIVPIASHGPVEMLQAQGRLVAPEGDLLALGAPLRPVGGVPLPSAILARNRAQER